MIKPLLMAVLLASLVVFAEPVGKPNILWLTSEDNSAEWLGCYGNPHAETPVLDKLAGEGFQYMHAYANAPVCAPSRSTWITGVMAVSMGTHPMRSFYRIPHDHIRLYPDFLNDNGYHTGNWKKMDYNFGGRDNKACWDNSEPPDWKVMEANQPFFQVINFGQTHESQAFGDIEHTSHDPAKTVLAKYHPDVPEIRKNYALYHDCVNRLDTEIGKTLKQLEEAGLADNTIVVYNSDHGGVLPRSKRFLFQNSLHCPLIIRIPERYKALWPAGKPGTRIDRLVSFVDMPKTWLSITGSSVPGYMQGTIFLGPQTEPEQQYHFAFRGRMDERIDNARAICDKRFLYIRNYMPYVPWMQHLTYLWNMKATQSWEQSVEGGLAVEMQSRFFSPKEWTEELYDMETDPDNVNNLVDSPEHREVLLRMRRELRRKQETICDAGLIPETERVRLAKQNNTTIYEMARNPNLYDVGALLDAADLALEKNADHLPALRKLLDSPHVGMRYWGIVGCFLLNDKQAGLQGINDESHEVRAMAAWLLVRVGEKEKGFACLSGMIENESYSMLSILNIADWMGEDGRALLPAIRTLEFEEKFANQFKYEIRMRDSVLARFSDQSHEAGL